jgi:superfamily II DNA or RNA helicase
LAERFNYSKQTLMFDRTKANEQRDLLVKECVAKHANEKHLLIELPTGTGKGKMVAELIRASRSEKPWLCVVPEIVQVKNYKADLEKHGNGDLLGTKIEDVICYASLKNYVGRAVNLHFNEAHRLSELRTDLAGSFSFDQVISDSGTVSVEIRERLFSIAPYTRFYRSLNQVIELGILPEPIIEVIPVPLRNNNVEYKVKHGKETKSLSAPKMYDFLDSQVREWQSIFEDEDRGGQQFQKNKWMQAALKRKRFIGEYKQDEARRIIETDHADNRLLCFCGSVAQAIELGKERAIHSERPSEENLTIVEDFNTGRQNHLFACMMGIEGMNFDQVDYGMIIQLDNSDRIPRQKAGRTFRADVPHLKVLYVPGTQDEKYLRKFLKFFDEKFVRGYSN